MLWYALIGLAIALAVGALVLPTWRRIAVFYLTAAKYLFYLLAEVTYVRRLWLAVTGRTYAPLTLPRALRLMCEDLGPTFLKFGQIVASSTGVFPERYVVEFQKCLDRVRPFPYAQVVDILGAELSEERAAELTEIDPVPLASASIAQVHAATLADGSEVVIKIQRPGIEQRTDADVRIMRLIARIMARLLRDAEAANPVAVVDDFAKALREELDFRKEAENLDRFNEIMAALGHRTVRAPRPHWALTCQRVLVMERFFGIRIDDVTEIEDRGIDAESQLVLGMRAWFQSVILHGFFHGDVHAGNLMLLDSGDIGFLDFGIVGRFSDEQRWQVTDYIISFVTGDYRKLARLIADMGGAGEDLDVTAFAGDLEATCRPLMTMSFGEIKYADLLPAVQRIARTYRLTLPAEFVLITKQMLYFDRYAKLLAPNLNVFTDPRLVASMMGDISKARAEYRKRVQAIE